MVFLGWSCIAALFLPLSYLSVSSGTSQVFSWFQSITSSNLLVNWSVFALDHIALHRALEAQGYSRENLPYKILVDNMLVLYHYFFIIIFIYRWICCIIKGQWKFANFFSSYFVIPLFFGLYIFSKLFSRPNMSNQQKLN